MTKMTPTLVKKTIHGQKVEVKVYPTSFKNRDKYNAYPKMKKGRNARRASSTELKLCRGSNQ